MSLPVNRIPLVLGSASGGGSANTDDLVESITYDGTNKKLIVTKDDGDTSDVPISDLSAIATNTNTINNLYSDIQPHSTNDSILQVKKVNQNTFTDIQMRDAYSKTQSDGKYYDSISFNQSNKQFTLRKGIGTLNTITLPITDAVEQSPFAGLNFVDGNELPMIRQSINTHLLSPPTNGYTLNEGFNVSGQQTFTSHNFIMDSNDGHGILEIYFGDVNVSANDTLFKIVTEDYRHFDNNTNWGDMEFKMNGSNQFHGVFNNGTNDVIPVMAGGYTNFGQYFLHNNATNAQNPSGYHSNNGRFGQGSDVGIARAAFGTAQSWNNANASFNNGTGGSSGFINDHYVKRSWDGLGLFANTKDIENKAKTSDSNFYLWKAGPEILNGGSFSITSNDHIMIKVNRQSIEYYKNGSIVHTQSNSGNARVGGVTTLLRKIVLGKNTNSSNFSFSIRKINWHGNQKTALEATGIYLERDFVAGGGTGSSNVDLTPYFNGAQYTNNSGNVSPTIALLSASGNTTLTLRNSYTKAEVNALLSPINTQITALQGDVTTIQSTITLIQSDITTINANINQLTSTVNNLSATVATLSVNIGNLNSQVSSLTNIVNNLGGGGGGGGGGGWNPFG